jgi:hypothetical protein
MRRALSAWLIRWNNRALRGVARHDHRASFGLRERALLDVQAEVRHAMLLIRTVTLEPVVGQNRPDFAIRIHSRLAVGGKRSRRGDRQK